MKQIKVRDKLYPYGDYIGKNITYDKEFKNNKITLQGESFKVYRYDAYVLLEDSIGCISLNKNNPYPSVQYIYKDEERLYADFQALVKAMGG